MDFLKRFGQLRGHGSITGQEDEVESSGGKLMTGLGCTGAQLFGQQANSSQGAADFDEQAALW